MSSGQKEVSYRSIDSPTNDTCEQRINIKDSSSGCHPLAILSLLFIHCLSSNRHIAHTSCAPGISYSLIPRGRSTTVQAPLSPWYFLSPRELPVLVLVFDWPDSTLMTALIHEFHLHSANHTKRCLSCSPILRLVSLFCLLCISVRVHLFIHSALVFPRVVLIQS